jgi:hypothetical protein
MKEPCNFCEETRRKMVRLAAIVDAWTRSKIGVASQLAAEIDRYFAEQYRRANEEN